MTEEVTNKKTGKGLGIAGLIVGAIGLLLSFIPMIGTIGLFFAWPALILSLIGMIIALKNSGAKVVTIIALVISIAAVGISYYQYSKALAFANEFENTFNEDWENAMNDLSGELDQLNEDLENELGEELDAIVDDANEAIEEATEETEATE